MECAVWCRVDVYVESYQTRLLVVWVIGHYRDKNKTENLTTTEKWHTAYIGTCTYYRVTYARFWFPARWEEPRSLAKCHQTFL